jgi:hypothetical protein
LKTNYEPLHSDAQVVHNKYASLIIGCWLGCVISFFSTTSHGKDTENTADFLSQHCFDCHNAQTTEGGLNLCDLDLHLEDNKNLARWINVFDKVDQGEMPPKDENQPSSASRTDFLNSLRARLQGHALDRQKAHGRVVLRRLNRSEFANTLRDLLGVSAPLEELLPEDGRADGFENVGAALNLSVAHLERYLQAADQAINEATISSLCSPTTKIRTDYEESWHDYNHGFQNIQWANANDGRLAIRWTDSAANGTLRSWHPSIPDRRYRFRIRARAMMQRDVVDANGKKTKSLVYDRHIIAKVGIGSLLKDGLAHDEAYFELSPDNYREFEYEARVPEGHSLSIVPYRLMPDKKSDRVMSGDMFVVVDWIEIEGPLFEGEWPPRGHQLLYGNLPLKSIESAVSNQRVHVVSQSPEVDARRLIANFLTVVFRRPAENSEIESHLDLFREQSKLGRSFDASLRPAYKMALASPQFLFLQETPGKLSDYALAARLSYGLWGSLPDSELMQIAAEGRLNNPRILREQTERLLSAPNATRFTRQFLGGWLNLRDIDFTQPDTTLYPEFDSYLQFCMLAESEQYFEELVRHNLGVRHIVHSDFAMLNARLAEHYELAEAFQRPDQTSVSDGVTASERPFPAERSRLVKIQLDSESKRGGFLTQGAILKVSANGTTTSPVVRGAYVLDRILGTPPAPPPSDVPSVEPDIRGATTIRQQLAKHRDQSACAGCHAKLDPPGFALENYDVTGRWRTHYRAIPETVGDKGVKIPGSGERLYSQGLPVESHYSLADGREFTDIDGFKQIVLEDQQQLARCVVSKLITYLTGATPDFADREIVDQIVSEAAPSQYGMRDLIHGVIQSRVFTHK